mmetsp:Transcript_9192/g.6950  ORF Transcript_9192/g.6950 Transcript_9192/m.6950 type:complete len:84 (-) Transcript_9192:39-290(-)
MVEAGMRVPADCILFEGFDVTVDESLYFEEREALTTKTVFTGTNKRENPDCFLLKKSLVMTGQGRALVAAVGERTQLEERGLA